MDKWRIILQKWKLLFLIGGLTGLGGVIFLTVMLNQKELVPYESIDLEVVASEQETQADSEIIIDLKGLVVNPGVYTLKSGSRMHELIQKAGGFCEKADEKQINLAEELGDQQMVYVPSVEESPTNDQSVSSNLPKEQKKLNINTANLEELQSLSGIGQKKAQAIIDYREENGLFKTVDALKEIAGIGEKTVEKLQDSIRI